MSSPSRRASNLGSAAASSFQIRPQGMQQTPVRRPTGQSQGSFSNDGTLSQNSGTAISGSRHRRGGHSNSIAFAGQIMSGTNRQITIPSVSRNLDSQCDYDEANVFKDREPEPENFYFGSPKKNRQRQNQIHDQIMERMQTSAFNGGSPPKKLRNVLEEDLSQLEQLT